MNFDVDHKLILAMVICYDDVIVVMLIRVVTMVIRLFIREIRVRYGEDSGVSVEFSLDPVLIDSPKNLDDIPLHKTQFVRCLWLKGVFGFGEGW